MAKWADYVVVAVSYNAAGTRIARMKTRQDLGAELSNDSQILSTGQVADAIVKGTTFISATFNEKSKKWDAGADLDVIVKTVQDGKVTDNLDHLPRF